MKVEHRETEWEGLNWIHLAKDRNQSQIINLRSINL
jgi:hypothetical protein